MDLLKLPVLGKLLRWKHARTLMQIPLLLVAGLMVWDGLTGSQLAARNLATVLTWVIYRGVLVLALLVAGNLFCMACPFMLPRNLARRFVRPVRHWPRRLRNKWVAAGLLALFLFSYEYFGLWATPWWTAWLIIGYFAAALLIDSLFRGAPFCKYVCPLGQFNFVSSLVSPLEVRVRSPHTCATCTTKDCIKGNANQRGCELWLFQPRKVGNLDCTFCLDCVHACPHDNIGLVARLPGPDLWTPGVRSGVGDLAKRPDMAVLILLFTFGALVNAFNMISPVYALQAWLAGVLGTDARLPLLGALFAVGLVLEPAAVLLLTAWASRRLGGGREPLPQQIVAYAAALAPLGFGIWLAHYTFHFATGFWTIVPVAQLVLASVGLPSFGPPRWDLGALFVGFQPLPLQYGFIGLGLLGALLAIERLARLRNPAAAWRAGLPWALLALLLAAAALWVMTQPMEMRGIAVGVLSFEF
ncbi:MAG: hypothetical protein OHK0022_26670 [Roseiflexaceae bacterium]